MRTSSLRTRFIFRHHRVTLDVTHAPPALDALPVASTVTLSGVLASRLVDTLLLVVSRTLEVVLNLSSTPPIDHTTVTAIAGTPGTPPRASTIQVRRVALC